MKNDKLAKLFYSLIGSSYKGALKEVLGINNSKEVYKKAHKYYLKMLESVDREPVKRFKLNILDACMVGSIYLALDKNVTCDQMYQMNKYVINHNFFYKKGLKKKNRVFTIEGRNTLKDNALKSMNQDNPYDWKYDIIDGSSINEYTCNYYTCGIKYLFEKWNISEITPSLCKCDYDTAELSSQCFSRKGTLYDGDKCCDCHYKLIDNK